MEIAMNGWPIPVDVRNSSGNSGRARVIAYEFRGEFMTLEVGKALVGDVEYWLLIEVQNDRWDRAAIEAALADVRKVL
jgi:hypothetical protein